MHRAVFPAVTSVPNYTAVLGDRRRTHVGVNYLPKNVATQRYPDKTRTRDLLSRIRCFTEWDTTPPITGHRFNTRFRVLVFSLLHVRFCNVDLSIVITVKLHDNERNRARAGLQPLKSIRSSSCPCHHAIRSSYYSARHETVIYCQYHCHHYRKTNMGGLLDRTTSPCQPRSVLVTCRITCAYVPPSKSSTLSRCFAWSGHITIASTVLW